MTRTNLTAYFRSVGFGNGSYVAAGAGGAIWTSPDGVQWTNRSLGTNVLLMSVAFGKGIFVATSAEGLVFTSGDSITWTRQDSGTREQLWAVTFGNDRFVAVGWAGNNTPSVATTSIDGVNWAAQDLDTTVPLVSIAYGNGQFVSPGYGASVMSSDGLHWSVSLSSFTGQHGAAFGNGVFVATYGTQMLTSKDGIAWFAHNTPAQGDLQDMTFSGTTFVAVGLGGTVISSVDGTNWVAHSTPITQEQFLGVTYANGRFTAVGSQGAIVQSAPLEPVPPLIVLNPADRTLKVGAGYTNRVAAESSLPFTYQWRVNGMDVPGATNDTIVITPAPLTLSGEHSVVVANSAGAVTSSIAHVLIAEPISITVQPVSQTVPQGGAVTLSVSASGTLPIGFRWRRNGVTTNFMILHSPQSFLAITNLQTNANYTVAVTNAVSNPGVLSAVAKITVLPDSDGDGLPDEWEQAHGLNSTNPLDAQSDSDRDGVSNLDEYLAGTDPQDARSYLRIERISISGPAIIEFRSVSGKTYTVQYSEALGNGSWNKLTDVAAEANDRTEFILDPAPLSHRYYRLLCPRQP